VNAAALCSGATTSQNDGTRALIEVLLLHRHLRHDHVVAGLAAAANWSVECGRGRRD